MSLKEAHRGGIKTCVGIGPHQRLGLTIGPWRIDRLETSIARGTDAMNHCIDLVAVALGIGKALEGNHADSFSNHHAFGVLIKRSDVLVRGEGGSF